MGRGEVLLRRRSGWAVVALALAKSVLPPTPTAFAAAATVLDSFSAVSYSNNDGTASWTSDWVETGDSGGAGGGDVAIVADDGDSRLRLGAMTQIQAGTGLADEVAYLTGEKGYVWVNQWSLRPGG